MNEQVVRKLVPLLLGSCSLAGGHMTLENGQRLHTLLEGRNRLGIGRTKLNSLIQSGELRSVKIGRARRIPSAALDEYIERLEREAAAGSARL